MLKEIAWNRIRFQAPSNWNIAGISSSYLLLEDKAGPVMEIKWSVIKGKFSAKKQLRRLLTHNNKQLVEPVRECPTPSDWQNSLKGFESTCFSWKSYNTGAKGLILFCNTCKKITLLQFYYRNSEIEIIYPSILSSYSDHNSEKQISWSIYDIRFKLDEKFSLIGHRFESGEFELNFTAKGQKLRFYRWSPASIILSNMSLFTFAKIKFNLLKKISALSESENQNIVKLDYMHSKNPFLNRCRRLMGLPVISGFCIWHVPDKNRILGVVMDSREINIKEDFEKICSGYECF